METEKIKMEKRKMENEGDLFPLSRLSARTVVVFYLLGPQCKRDDAANQ